MSITKQIILLNVVLLLFVSCKRDELQASKGSGKVVFSARTASFNERAKLGLKSNSESLIAAHENVLKGDIHLNEDYFLSYELLPIQNLEDTPTPVALKANSKATAPANTFQQELREGAQYKVAVFDKSGKYITERDYAYQKENSTEELWLDGDNTYTFVAYSFNNTQSLPAISFADANNKTMEGASVNNVANNLDLMYYKTTRTVSGNEPNYLDIIFKHCFSIVQTSLDATPTGYDVLAIDMNVAPQYANANLKLSDGSTTTVGDAGNQTVAFTGFNSPTVTGTPVLINTGEGKGTITINSLTIGPLKEDLNKIIASDLNLSAGVSYSLQIQIKPQDKYEIINGVKVATLNGKSWMLHNLGAAGPDNNPLTVSSHGNFYQWGRKAVVGGPTTHDQPNENWSGLTDELKANSWNVGTEDKPKKNTANDPCPDGFRVPTRTELDHLLEATGRTNQGNNWVFNINNYSSGAIFTSKRNKAVKLIVPAQGLISAKVIIWDNGTTRVDPNGFTERGTLGRLWASTNTIAPGNYVVTQLNINENEAATVSRANMKAGPAMSYNIRCIRE